MKTFILKEWAVTWALDDPYLAPEANFQVISGMVFNNVKFPDGARVRTSRIIGVEGRKIMTATGSIYYLEGPPAQGYTDYLKRANIELDEVNPIKYKNSVKHD